jgi:hypothetical protein
VASRAPITRPDTRSGPAYANVPILRSLPAAQPMRASAGVLTEFHPAPRHTARR